ncbi:DUF2939 domain-containing protein [Rhodopila sp.]|uniref:DUF2939 domain-containing protein n=1 Tax=Rhodopila sp. TaxID=2480087 RepID=UPI003D0B2085
MRVKWPLLATVLTVGVAYVAYPYVTLYRLGVAMRGADASTLEALVDWPSVREGIKEDICDLVVDEPNTTGETHLPPFGASFMRGIASSKIDQKVTPQAIVAAASALPDGKHDEPQQGADVHLAWAFFDSPTVFSVSLRAPGLAEPIRLEMKLRHGEWQVHRVWLPDALLGNAPSRT